MNKKKYIILVVIILILLTLMLLIVNKSNNNKVKANEKFKIVTSFYPIYNIVLNLTYGAQNVEVINMTDTNVGCLHNYTLTTSDMKNIEKADVFVQNGLGLENFIDKIISTYPNLKIIDSSINIENLEKNDDEINPHIWTSIEKVISQVENVYLKLCEYNPENVELYTSNYKKYIEQLNDLKQKYEEELKDLTGVKVICLNESLTYLLKEQNMEATTVETDHEEGTLSADALKNLILKMKNENIQIIIIDKNDNPKNAETLAHETGAKLYVLNSALSGEDSKEAYINVMFENLEKLKEISK